MISVANAPCSWGVIENVAGERGGYVTVLDEMHATGFAGTELGDWGFMPTDPNQLRRELEQRDLKLLASWVSVYLHDADRHAQSEAEAIRTAHLLAEVGGPSTFIVLGNDPYTNPMRTLNAGRIKPEHQMSEAQWHVFAEGANRVARAVKRATGLRTVFHHHIGTWVETPEETAKLLSLTDPEVVGLCFDTGHYRFGGGDPVAGLRQHADRRRAIAPRKLGRASGGRAWCVLRVGARRCQFPSGRAGAECDWLRWLDRRRAGCVAWHGHA